jgi:hypothetical protein
MRYCATCGLPKAEHKHDGACYGVCGQFSETAAVPHMPDDDFLKLVSDMMDSYSAMSGFVIDCNVAVPITPKQNRKEWEYARGQALKAMTGCRAIVELLEPELQRRMPDRGIEVCTNQA